MEASVLTLVNPDDPVDIQLDRQAKIIEALVRRANRQNEVGQTAYSAFQSAIELQTQVAATTRDLEIAATEEMLDELGIGDAYELTGLYDGIALPDRSVEMSGTMPDTVWLYRRPILDEWAERGDVALDRLIAHVLVHEIAHHFGWSDEQISEIDDWRL